MIDINNLGTFSDINAVWAAYPEGGNEGDYLYIGTTKYRWDKYERVWKTAGEVTESPARKLVTSYGDMAVNNDLHVGGTLYYHRLQGYDLGLFASLAALQAAHPTPKVGQWAFVVHPTIEDKYQIYTCETAGTWTLSVSETTLDTLNYPKELMDAMQQIADGRALTGYRAFSSLSDLPTTDVDPTLGYLVGRHLYVWVGTGGGVLDGRYQDCGYLRGEKGDKGDKGNTGMSVGDNFEAFSTLEALDGKTTTEKEAMLPDGNSVEEALRTHYAKSKSGIICDNVWDFAICDSKGNEILSIDKGHIATKYFDSSKIVFKRPYQHRTAFTVNVDVNNFLLDDFADVSINTYSTPTYFEDNCVIYLPSSYSKTGIPTKAIIYCKHGASTITPSGDDLFTASGNMGKIIPYLVSLGYAVIAADGLPDGWAADLGLCERVVGNYVAVQSTIKAWHYAIENYNIDPNCAFIFGYSQGGHYVQNVIDNSNIPIAAAAELSPVCSMRYHQWDLAASVTVGGVTFSKGARLNVARIFGYPTVMNDTELLALTYDDTKVYGFDPWTRNVSEPYLGFVQSGNLWKFPTGTTVDDITMKKNIRCPLKIWCASNDNALGVDVMKAFVKAVKNAGQVADIRVYSTGGHSIPNSQTQVQSVIVNGTTYGVYPVSLDIADWFRINGGY
jgi:dienelactone hydrolase